MSQVESVNSPNKPMPSTVSLEGGISFGMEVRFHITPDTSEYFYVSATVYISGSSSYQIESEKVRTTYGSVLLRFNTIQLAKNEDAKRGPVNSSDEYHAYDVSFLDKITNTQNAITVTLAKYELMPLHPPHMGESLPPALPILQLNKCTISPEWLIGVRNILLIDSND